ncbi:MAG: 6-phosphogluconolactonase [Gammaproteobacteria bacterium]|nr:6-phosphogluconolactonase [Gammaproteobacteria bacterium]
MDSPEETRGSGAGQGEAPHWIVLPDAEAVAHEAAQRILGQAERAIADHGVFRIVLAGGSTPESTYRLLAGAQADWGAWEIYFGDERCLPPRDLERNSTMVDRAWLNHVEVPAGHIFPIPAERGPDEAAQSYAMLVRGRMPFDMVLLGMGEDGHTASLFPGQEHPGSEPVHAVRNAPKAPPERVSLSAASLGNTRALLVLVTGAGKREALSRWRAGEHLPVASVVSAGGAVVLVDRDAWGET